MIDQYDVERVRQYREVFLKSDEGMSVLEDILNELGHFATVQLDDVTPEVQLALEHQAKLILDKLGIFRVNNLDGYIAGLKLVHPRYYDDGKKAEEE